MDTFDTLNGIYKPLCARARAVRAALRAVGTETVYAFYNNHYVKRDGAYVAEAYPIPVLSAREEFDVGVDLDLTFVEFHVPREKALALDYPALRERYSIDVYGAEDFLGDFPDSGEETVCVCLCFEPEEKAEEIAGAVQFFRILQLGLHNYN